MEPLAAYKPPLENRETEDLFERVYASLKDIDRSKPLSSDAQRVNEVLAAYAEVRAKYIAEATALGVIN